jgi:hypothetical protein
MTEYANKSEELQNISFQIEIKYYFMSKTNLEGIECNPYEEENLRDDTL